jgi:ADP-heptose:LPS heptosyltransferase
MGKRVEKSVPLVQFERLAHLPNVRLISLQKYEGSEQLANCPEGMNVETLGTDFDFLDTAAVMAHLDLVITIDTSVAHLAGALGVPVWVMLKHVPDWRWLIDRPDTPWYPTMKLFRQRTRGDWAGVVSDIETALTQALAEGCNSKAWNLWKSPSQGAS